MDVVSFVLEKNKFSALNPVQRAALDAGLLEGKNIVVSSPTASGKTLVAEIAMVKHILEGRKALYTCPLRALAYEHFSDFSRKYEFKTALSVGDYDSADHWLAKYDAIFTTYEKLDSLVRHGAPWLKDVGVLVVDEIHEIDSDRGPTLEVLLTRIRSLYSPQLLALSATIPNAPEIAKWLDAELVFLDWRPVTLKEGVYFAGEAVYNDGSVYVFKREKDDVRTVVLDTLERGKQILIFTTTRRQAEALARRLRDVVRPYARRRGALRKISERVLSALESPTRQCKELAEDILYGVAFHHAGLVSAQRLAVEEGFRRGEILVVVATPTLAAGVNLPAFRVLIHSVRRSTHRGVERIPVREYKQMAGRAGRPKYDEYGEALLLARSEEDKQLLLEEYVLGDPENVYSRLGSEPALRFHTLALIATGATRNMETLRTFFLNTFYAFQYGDVDALMARVERIVDELSSMGFVVRGEKLVPTPLGRRVAELYIDPLTGYSFLRYIRSPKLGTFPFLFLLSDTSEQYPYASVSRREEGRIWAEAMERVDELPFGEEHMDDVYFPNKFKLALILEAWVEERSEDEILEDFDISPGLLRAHVNIVEWLAYAVSELALLEGEGKVRRFAERMRERIRHGVREELLPLVQFSGIGRVRARKLYNAGYRSVEDLKRADVRELAKLIGPKIAVRLKEQLGQKVRKEEVRGVGAEEQTTLDLFME